MIRLAFRNLFRNVRRTIAILLTVALGSGALFTFDGFIQGVLEEYRESTIHSHNGHGQIHPTGYRENVYEEPWAHWISDYATLSGFLHRQDEINYLFPRVTINGMLTHGKVSITGQGQGIDGREEAKFFDSLNIIEGKQLSNQENGILLGKGLAKALDVHPGHKVTLYTKSVRGGISKGKFEVVGVFYTGSVAFDNHIFRIQLPEAQKLLKTNKIESVALGLSSHTDWEKVSSKINQRFSDIETASFAELDKIYYQHSVQWLEAQFYVVQLIILSIVLLGVFNTVSASVLERKQEIGNLRANGESAIDVMKIILSEGFFLGLLGGFLGIVFSYVIAKGVLHQGILMPPGPGSTKQFYISFSFNLSMAALTLALSIFSSLLASFFAGLKIVKMAISKALRAI